MKYTVIKVTEFTQQRVVEADTPEKAVEVVDFAMDLDKDEGNETSLEVYEGEPENLGMEDPVYTIYWDN